jgi:glycosyltransferase involved in cell wall biosynthesis
MKRKILFFMKYKLSVILNAYNEEVDLPECIASLKKMSIKPFEILVVDNGSKDRTAELAKKAGAKVFTIKPRSRGLARDFGWKQAKGNIVAYLDSDMIVNKDWAKEILKKFDEGADGVIDRIHVWKPDNAYTKSLDAFYSFRIDNNYKPFLAWAYKTSVLTKVGGFKDVWLEDGELGKRVLKAGYKILLAEKAIRYHKGPPRTFWNTVKRNYFFGKHDAKSIYKNHPESLPRKRLGLFSLFWLSELVAIILGVWNLSFLLWLPTSFILLYLALFGKFLFINGAIGKVSIRNCILISLASLIRALIWPLGIIKGMLEK